MALESQAALEQAVVDLLQTAVADGGLGWAVIQCGRCFDGRPPPLARDPWYAAVWHDGSRQSGRNGAGATALDQEFALSVTFTAELIAPFDRLRERRDFLEGKVNDLVALVHKDVYDNRITNAANVLAGMRRGDLASGASQPVGFVRGLAWQGTDAVTEEYAAWLNARDPESTRACLVQRVRFGGAVRVQALGNME